MTEAAYAAPGLIDAAVRSYVENPDRLPPVLLRAQARAIAMSDTSSRLSRVGAPTLVAVGEQDILTPPVLSRALRDAIPNAALALLPAGHGNIVEAAASVSSLIAAFLQAHAGQ